MGEGLSCLSPGACSAASAAQRLWISVNGEEKSFMTIHRPSPKGPTQIGHRGAQSSRSNPTRGTDILNAVCEAQLFCGPRPAVDATQVSPINLAGPPLRGAK